MYYSCLFLEEKEAEKARLSTPPAYFKDLNLSAIFTPLLEKNQDLTEFFYTPLQDKMAILYRQEILRDIEMTDYRENFRRFSQSLRQMAQASEKYKEREHEDYPYLTEGRLLADAERYCQQVENLEASLESAPLRSKGLKDLTEYLKSYVWSQEYISLRNAVHNLRKNFSNLRYVLHIKQGTVSVHPYEGESDLSEQILDSFARFRQDKVKDYRRKVYDAPYAEHIENAILSLLTSLYPEPFDELKQFYQRFSSYIDETLLNFARECRFYLCWLDLIDRLRIEGLSFCYPNLLSEAQEIWGLASFDLALALKQGNVVTNDFELMAPEKIILITGPNQGGKTTFARTFGQLHYLSSLGLSVPGQTAQLALFDEIYSHFGREEDMMTRNGKLQDDLLRIHEILQQATQHSIVIINEMFNSTTLEDALALGKTVMRELIERGCFVVNVSFLDELSTLGPEVVSMMSTVSKENSLERTFKIVRKKADGLAFALDIAKKYQLTYEQIKERLQGQEVERREVENESQINV